MFIAGMQKLTLLDFPGVVACTLFTAGCNFRCPWCHNAGLVLPEEASDRLLESGEVLSFLEKRKGVLDGVCVTGGEPLLHAELPDFLKRVKDLGYRVKLDTNGSFPERLEALVREKLADRVAMDIKNGPSRYAETVGLRNLDLSAVTASKDFLLSDAVDYELFTGKGFRPFPRTRCAGFSKPYKKRTLRRSSAGSEKGSQEEWTQCIM